LLENATIYFEILLDVELLGYPAPAIARIVTDKSSPLIREVLPSARIWIAAPS
jgi:hypothetical protein